MNYLGHLYLSNNDPGLMLANLYGDFVKGRDFTYLPEIVQKGVKLHRDIDDYIDHHPLILKSLNDYLYAELPKVANIAIDLYMDHLLAKHWSKYHNLSLQEFENRFFKYALNRDNQTFKNHVEYFKYPDEFIHLIRIIHNQSWILQYEKIDGLRMASAGLSKRISFNNNLNEADLVYLKYKKNIENIFFSFMEDAKIRFHIS